MGTELTLPAEVTEHFAKANKLHTYVLESLGEATKHALETGRELLAAKAAIPHGRWEEKCGRLFDGTPRMARFYMQFARDITAIPKRQVSAVLLLEGTLDGAAKAARRVAAEAGGKQSPNRPLPPRDESYGEACEPEDLRGIAAGIEPETPRKPQFAKKLDREAYYQQWDQAIGPLVRLVDKIAEGLGERFDPHQVAIQDRLNEATDEMAQWMGVEG